MCLCPDAFATSSVQLPIYPMLHIPFYVDHYKLISENLKNKNNYLHILSAYHVTDSLLSAFPGTNSGLYQEDHKNAKCNNILKQLAWNKEKSL